MFQQFAVQQDNGEFERRIRPYVSQVLMVIETLIPFFLIFSTRSFIVFFFDQRMFLFMC